MRRSIDKELVPHLAVEVAERLGILVSVARRQRLWTQADLAAKAEVGLTTLAAIERGGLQVQLGHWLKVLWAVDQLHRLAELSRPDGDATGVELMVERLPKRVHLRRRRA